MTVVRVNKTKDFTVMSNHHLRNKNLSLKAKGLLSMMFALPDDWNYTIEGLVKICKENETAISTAINELKDNGYLVVTKLMPNQTKSGRIEYVYDIYEFPVKAQEPEKQGVEILPLENQGQLNTNKQSTNKQKTNNISLFPTDVVDEKDIWFQKFYELYPKKVDKKKAEQKFKKCCNTKKMFDLIMNALSCQIERDFSFRDKQYIPSPAVWLNNNRWDDEIIDRRGNGGLLF